jgi:hypothetical protein
MGQKYEAIQQRLEYQRIFYIVDSYSLDGDDTPTFRAKLDQLLLKYPAAQIEFAMVETLVQNWATIPLPRGQVFLGEVIQLLSNWEITTGILSAVPPSEFEQITGLTAQRIHYEI